MVHFDGDISHIDEIFNDRSPNDMDSIILYSKKPKVRDVVHGIKMGAFDFLEMPFNVREMELCLLRAAEQNRLNLIKLMELSSIASNLTRLTLRENMILTQILEGNSNKIIAYNLNISSRTVENHRSRIMQKMSAKNITHLINMMNKM
jgi:two-component system, LuxR family, response regulator FixJ